MINEFDQIDTVDYGDYYEHEECNLDYVEDIPGSDVVYDYDHNLFIYLPSVDELLDL